MAEKTSTTQIGARANAQCIGKGPMKTSSRYFQCAAEFGNVNGPSVRCIYVILGFADEAGTGTGAGIGACTCRR